MPPIEKKILHKRFRLSPARKRGTDDALRFVPLGKRCVRVRQSFFEMCERIANKSLLPKQSVLPPLNQRKLQREPIARSGEILPGEQFPNFREGKSVLLEKEDHGYLVHLPPIIEPVAVGRCRRGGKETGFLIVFQRSRRYAAESREFGYGKAFIFHAVFLPKGLDLYVTYRFMISSTPKKEKRISHGTHTGKRGAAAASRFSISAETVWMLYRTGRELRRVAGGKTVLRKSYAVLMAKIGLPSIAQRSVLALGAMVLQTLVNDYGTDGINSYTAANTISNFLLVPVLACCTGYETFAAQNLGAGKTDRVRSGWRMLLLSGLVLNLALTAATALGAGALTRLYLPDRDSAAFALARLYLLLLIPNYFLQFGKSSLEAVFKAHLKISLVTVSAMLSLAVRVALGYALAPSYGITALAWATNAGSAAALALCFVFYRVRFRGMPA